MQINKIGVLSTILALALVSFTVKPGHTVSLATVSPAAAEDFNKVAGEMSSYLSERTPFFASLGRNDYRAALPGALAPMPSFLVSAGAGLGIMGEFGSIEEAATSITSIGVGSMDKFPFLIGPSLYARVALPWLPIVGGFDVGFKYIPALELENDDLKYENGGYGFDIRYALLRDIPLIPLIHLSLAVGFAYDQLDGSFKTKQEIKSSLVNVKGQFGPEWSVNSKEIFLQATAKILLAAVKVGVGYILPGGETKTSLTGQIYYLSTWEEMDPLVASSKAEDGFAKLTAGVGINLLPFINFYVEYNQNLNTSDMAATAAINATF